MKCRNCGKETPVLKTVETEIICRVDGRERRCFKWSMPLCEECMADSMDYMKDAIDEFKKEQS